ncbi:hypothetical protein SAMN06269185_0009 [Natronoarchaeum philippinense]|uniref:PKD domain-containing protein n=1 Tax=Natronoarchaeum philippinense TaxID=558529 RepID=A0A285N0R1_NATPI|nr:PKD domain-containing protein [Natronoarchaeum philippinense]SNZ02387.1 hypothetical protein SAMN06269185_0009 [Natronoarchaeum philippinense]
MKFVRVVLLGLVVTGALTPIAATGSPTVSPALDTDKPFAEAGLDQTATVGDRVLLDGGGSRAASGVVSQYDWTITGPNGSTFQPACSRCVRTSFVPNRSGRYAVTLTVTDDSGRSHADTMYVDARVVDGPSVSISGPRRLVRGRTGEFTADVRTGDAELSRIRWSVDDTEIQNGSLDGPGTVSLQRSFDDSGTSILRATVRDGAGRTQTVTHRVRVTGTGVSNTDPADPELTVRGPQLLTGTAPFDATYEIAGPDADAVDGATWYDDDGARGDRPRLDTQWKAGTHQLFAAASIGPNAYPAAFDNGTRVVVDPRPQVSVNVSQSDATLTGTISASDGFGNLDSVTLYVDGESSRQWSPDSGSGFRTGFSVSLPAEQDSSQVRVVATDERGQTAAASNTAGEPEIVRSGFVNGPVDSYHERIDPDRYTAVHETVVELNGVDPSTVSPQLSSIFDYSDLRQLEAPRRHYDPDTGRLTITSEWAGKAPSSYTFSITSNQLEYDRSSFTVTNSPPEPRIEIVDEGQDSHYEGHLLRVDVSGTFDPDGDKLYFNVQDRRRNSDDPDVIGIEFDDTPGLNIIGEQHRVDLSSKLYDYWSPDITSVEEVSTGPYNANDSIRFRFETETYQLANPEYTPSFDVQFRGSTGRVIELNKEVRGSTTGPDPAPKEFDHPRYVGTVEVDASSYLDSTNPYIGLANVEQPSQSRQLVELPSVNVFERDKLQRNNVEVTDIQYMQAKKYQKRTSSVRTRIRYQSMGYRIQSSSRSLDTITIESRETRPVVVDTKTFSSRARRKQYISTHPLWSTAGTTEQQTTREVTEWYDTRHSARGYTGKKRVRTTCSGPEAYRYGGRCVPSTALDSNTQYLHRYSKKKKIHETMYVAEKRETRNQWTHHRNVNSRLIASLLTRNSDLRIGSRQYSTQWNLVKSSDETFVSNSYEDPSDVIKTMAAVKTDLQYTKVGITPPDNKLMTIRQLDGDTVFAGYKTRKEIVDAVKSGAHISTTGCSIDGSIGC